MLRRYLMIIAVTLLIAGSFIGFLFFLDRLPSSRIATSKKPELVTIYPPSKVDQTSLGWTYEWFYGIRRPSLSISPDGKLLVFLTTIDQQCSLIGLNNKGEKIWMIDGLECYPHKDLFPRFAINNTHFALYWVDKQGGAGDGAGGTEISVFSNEGKKLWSKNLWGTPHLLDKNRILISQYKKRLGYSWNAEPTFPSGCINPNFISTAGGDVTAYDMRDNAVIFDIETGQHLNEVKLTGIEAVIRGNNQYIISCNGKTAIYNTNRDLLFSTASSGSIALSPDEKYLVIQKWNKTFDRRILEMYSLSGKMLWRKEVSPFFRFGYLEEERDDKGFTFLPNGWLMTVDSIWDKNSGMFKSKDVTISVFNDKGTKLWSKNEVDGTLVRAVGVPRHGKRIIIVAEDPKGVYVHFWPYTRLSDISMKFGLLGYKKHERLSRLYFVDFNGKVISQSSDIISGEVDQFIFNESGECVAITTYNTIHYFTDNHIAQNM